MAEVPELMTGMQLVGQGGYDQLVLRDDLPVPTVRQGDVLVKVLAAAVNNTDVNHRIAWYAQGGAASGSETPSGHLAEGVWKGGDMNLPRVQGADVCGRIVATGEGVDATRIGERVILDPVLRNPAGYLGADCDGGFAQYVRIPAANAHRVESPLSDTELASFPCAYSTAENLLTRSRVMAGETVLVTGASGGVGSAVVQLAKLRGARVIAVTVEAKAGLLLSLAADRIHRRELSLVEELGNNSVDVVIDLVGGPDWPELLGVLNTNGRYAASGAIAGPVVSLDLRTFYFKDLTLYGCTYFEREVFSALVRHIEDGKIRPLVAEIYPLSRMADAQASFLTKKHVGKIVLTV
ncbi:alcohol dehydrogenase family protein [Caballeronia sp. GAWG2-1]|uniref:alcohol dehydrogenase family protein n=1 Tax=Caballeronia sp. GAWG2-1 TaxID=2921744 RepID=UPI002028EF82|nr:alcohol dehydrogenase family protein [Caballeronia sp. GAWG2-1]